MNAPYKLLIADNDREFTESVEKILIGYEVNLTIVKSGLQVFDKAKAVHPHLILLEVELPEVDGIEVCQQIRDDKDISSTVIAFLTNNSDDFVQVAAFKAGCDDFISKSIKPRLLAYRILALLKLQHEHLLEPNLISKDIHNNSFHIDPERFVIVVDNRNIYLPKKQFLLLQYLYSNPSKVFTRESIFHFLWGYNAKVGLRTIDVYIRKIRESIGIKYIKTIKGVGYRFE